MSTSAHSHTSFRELSLSEPLLKSLDEVGYAMPTLIQELTIPSVLAGKDVVGQAQTGTGKTAAFALPLLSRLDLANTNPQVLVLVPTRELAIQVTDSFHRYASNIDGVRVLAIYGGQEYGGQLRQLRQGVHIVVGTPGRVMDHMRRGTLTLDSLHCLVLDEADEMLRMGFLEDVEWVLEQTPCNRQITLFSATMPAPIRRIAQKYLRNPEEIMIENHTIAAESIVQRYWLVSDVHKLDALSRILEAEPYDGVIVFVNTKNATVGLAEKLVDRGFTAAPLNGDLSQKQRESTITQLKKGKIDILVATDVAARGLDVERISHVINYDVPFDIVGYVHRIGRTGRVGRTGQAILFIVPRERRLIDAIEKVTRQKIEKMALPSIEMVNEKRIARFKQSITDMLGQGDLDIFARIIEEYQGENKAAPIEIAAALAKLAQGGSPLLLKELPQKKREWTDGRLPQQRERCDGRSRKPMNKSGPEQGMERYRIEIGHIHGVKPGNIVGAISNEAGIDGEYIGRIDIYHDHSTVDLPEGMPKGICRSLKGVYVSGQRLQISKLMANGVGPKNKKDKVKVKTAGQRRTGEKRK